MIHITPSYDPVAAVWFVAPEDKPTGFRVREAKSLAEMANNVGPLVKIDGYFPSGSPSIRIVSSSNAVRELMKSKYQNRYGQRQQTYHAPPPKKEVPKFIPPAKAGLKKFYWERRQHILNCWNTGLYKQAEIADAVGVSQTAVSDAIRIGRSKHDPRSTPKFRKAYVFGTPWTTEREERALQLDAEGESAGRIAMALGGVTRNAVIGKIARMKDRKRKAELKSWANAPQT